MINIEGFCKQYQLGSFIKCHSLTGGFMHQMFQVVTEKQTYAIKVLNEEVMARKEAYDNFNLSERIARMMKENGINVSHAYLINGNVLTFFEGRYYMVFDYIDGFTYKGMEITKEHCKKIGTLLAKMHSIPIKEERITEEKEIEKEYHFLSYSQNALFQTKPYKELYLQNASKYDSIIKRVYERTKEIPCVRAFCHRDLDPKNVMWKDNEPIPIDFEAASIDNPYKELLEVALAWSFFSNDALWEEHMRCFIQAYKKNKKIDVAWFPILCSNIIGRFDWLEYNLKRSLKLIPVREEEVSLGELEVTKTIHEINQYLSHIGAFYQILTEEEKKECFHIPFLEEKNITIATPLLSGFRNQVYHAGPYILKFCINPTLERKFQNEIAFYKEHQKKPFLPTLHAYDISKTTVPYAYEVIESIEGNTLYELWYQIEEAEKEKMIENLIHHLKEIHKEMPSANFVSEQKEILKSLLMEYSIHPNIITKLWKQYDLFFENNIFVSIHGDLHFDNIIHKDGEIYLIDFENTMVAPLDYEYRYLWRYEEEAYLWASISTDMLTIEKDYQNIRSMLLKYETALLTIPYLEKRFQVYTFIDKLQNHILKKEEILLWIDEIIGKK